MSTPSDIKDKDIERQRAIQRITNAYHRVFGSEDGKTVLDNLRNYFRTQRPAFERSLNHSFDPIAGAIRDGQREVVLFIEHKLSLPVIADDNIDKPQTSVIKP